MTDVSTTPSAASFGGTNAPTEVAQPAAEVPTINSADAALIAAELAPLLAPQSAAPAVAVPDNPPSPENLFTKGNIVEFAWDDPYDGPSSKKGIVVDTLPDEGAGARSCVAWFDSVSGPIGDHQLTAV